MVAYAYALTWLWFPHGLADQGKRHAEQAQRAEGMEMEHGMRGSWHDKLFSREGWRWIAHAFFMEWKMVWKEILFGFTRSEEHTSELQSLMRLSDAVFCL